MLLPETTQDVSQFMTVVSSHQCPFGIRSGGHSAFKGANSVDDGTTIDFSESGDSGLFGLCWRMSMLTLRQAT